MPLGGSGKGVFGAFTEIGELHSIFYVTAPKTPLFVDKQVQVQYLLFEFQSQKVCQDVPYN